MRDVATAVAHALNSSRTEVWCNWSYRLSKTVSRAYDQKKEEFSQLGCHYLGEHCVCDDAATVAQKTAVVGRGPEIEPFQINSSLSVTGQLSAAWSLDGRGVRQFHPVTLVVILCGEVKNTSN